MGLECFGCKRGQEHDLRLHYKHIPLSAIQVTDEGFQFSDHLESVHARHLEVKQHQRNWGNLKAQCLLCSFEALLNNCLGFRKSLLAVVANLKDVFALKLLKLVLKHLNVDRLVLCDNDQLLGSSDFSHNFLNLVFFKLQPIFIH